MSLLETKGLTVRFGGLTAVDGVDVSISRGETLGIIGPNGSGKTTFFNLLTGVYIPSSGTIRYQNDNLVGLPPHEINRRGIARTFQSSRLFMNLSVLDNVLIGASPRYETTWWNAVFTPGRVAAEMAEAMEAALELLNYFNPELASDCYRPVKELNQADRRRLEICRALIAEPGVLLLDEPAAGMDAVETQELMEDIRRLRARRPDLAVIIIEHDMTVIKGLAQRVIAFNYGKKIAEGTFEEVAANPEVREAYLGR